MALLAIWECPSPLTSHANAQSPTYAIAIHGGAGVEPAKLTPQQRKDHEDALRRAITHGRDLLAQGQPALAVVESTIRLLEEEPLFNAGRGAVFNNVGKHELDAAIMDGLSGKGGAVAGVTTIKNPISLARLVMSKTNHVLLIGDGAEKFADEMKGEPMIERVPNSYFSTEMRRREWEEAVQAAKSSADANRSNALPDPAGKGKSTVGCVALDREGNLAAGTSTGGLTNKKWGGRFGPYSRRWHLCQQRNAGCQRYRHRRAFHSPKRWVSPAFTDEVQIAQPEAIRGTDDRHHS